MQSLLRWSIENSTPLDSAPTDGPLPRREDLNPEMIHMLLGKPDAERMKDDVAIAVDTSKTEDERIIALDDLELLIEHIDNANNLESLKLWEPIQSLLTSEEASTDIKVHALWVIGTALQNNPSAQDAYLKYNPIPTLLSFLTPSPTSTVSARAKAIYTLSGLLKHNSPAVKTLSQPGVNGWEKLRDALQDPNIGVRRKTIFLLAALLVPTDPGPRSSSTPARNQPQPPPLLLGAPQPQPQPQIETHAQSSEGLSLRFIPAADPSSTPSASTVAFHNTDPAAETQAVPAPVNIHTPDDVPPGDVVHDNSHAANLRDASRSQTSELTLEALRKHGILDAVIASVVSPLPHGEDGENIEADQDYEEKALRLLHTYVVACRGSFTPSQKESLKKWVEAQKAEAGGAQQLEEKWNLTSAELSELTSAL